jgi:squalene-associated FAD-dependent desaturase
MNAMNPPHVAVVGGGLSGLAAALACVDAGASVTLLESRPRLGGATWSFEHHGGWYDNGQHVFLRCCTEYRRFLDRLGVSDKVVLQDRLRIPVVGPGGQTALLSRSDHRAPFHLAASLSRYPYLSPLERARAMLAALALRRLDPDDRALDERSFGDWLAEHGQHGRATDALWNLIALPTLNLRAGEASLAFAAMVFRTGLLVDAGAADIGYSRVPLAALHAEPAARALHDAGARVLIRAPVVGISCTADAVDGVVLADGRVDADAVVLAVPHDAAADLVPHDAAPDAARWHELGTSPIVNVHVIFDRRVTDLPFAAGLGTEVQWVFDRTDSAGLASGQCLAVSLSAADAYLGRHAGELADAIVAGLRDLFPHARAARVVDTLVTRERAATFRAAPGTRRRRPGSRTMVRGLTLAGAWTDTGWPATMEGAVRSGRAAAAIALAESSVDPSRAVA